MLRALLLFCVGFRSTFYRLGDKSKDAQKPKKKKKAKGVALEDGEGVNE
jgi:hypothetical protein